MSSDFHEDNGAPVRIRTSDPQIRSLVLYPAELRVRSANEAGPNGARRGFNPNMASMASRADQSFKKIAQWPCSEGSQRAARRFKTPRQHKRESDGLCGI